MKKTFGAIALLGASALVLAGCSAGPETGEIHVWFVGGETSQEARDYLVATFAEQNPGSTLVIDEQSADGLVDTLTVALSGEDGPDIVEVGVTEAVALTSTGALLDLSDDYEALGGDDLLPGFVAAGSYGGAFSAAPLYANPRVVFADPTLVSATPTTLDEYVASAKALAAAYPGQSGVYFAGQDWSDALPFVWANGGEVAVQNGDTWDAQLSSDASVAGLLQVQDLLMNASLAPRDGDGAEPWTAYCDNQAIQFSATSTALRLASACTTDDAPTAPSVYALPGKDGGAAEVLASGSSVGISSASEHPDLAKSALEIMLSDEFQTIYAENGLVPAKTSQQAALGDSPAALASIAAVGAAGLTPASPKWAEVESSRVLEDFMGQIALGGDVAALAIEVDAKIESILNG